MFYRGGHNVNSALMAARTKDGEIVRFRPSTCKSNLFPVTAEQRSYRRTCIIQGPAGRLPVMMDTGSIAENLDQHLSMHF